ncbi:MAG: hypothetical protein KA244_02455 [Deltaproteobacteria bacterium]|nr:hypothetical protein [Deltaproteobacteria bacterium]
MRFIAYFGLLALLGPLTGCQVRNFERCTDEAKCLDGYVCDQPDKTKSGTCVPSCTSTSCTAPLTCLPKSGLCGVCEGDTDPSCGTPGVSATPYCYSHQCVECTLPKHCATAIAKGTACNTTTHTCGPCQRHDECDSGVCAKDDALALLAGPNAISKGTCVPTERIQIVDTATCGSACSLPNALLNVTNAKPYILVRNFDGTMPISVNPAVAAKPAEWPPMVYIIGDSADLSPAERTATPKVGLHSYGASAALSVSPGVNLTVEGMQLYSAKTALLCDGGVSATPTSVRLIRSIIGSSDIGIESRPGCDLTVEKSWIGQGPSPVFDGTANSGNFQAMNLDSTRFEISNTVFLHNTKGPGVFSGILVQDSKNLKKSGTIVNSSFSRHDTVATGRNALAVDCNYATADALTIVNSIFVSTAAPASTVTYVHPNCRSAASFAYVATDDQSPSLAGTALVKNVSQAALLEDAVTKGNLRLKVDAPKAVTTGGIGGKYGSVTIPLVDHEGKDRPAGTVSIGAFQAAQ